MMAIYYTTNTTSIGDYRVHSFTPSDVKLAIGASAGDQEWNSRCYWIHAWTQMVLCKSESERLRERERERERERKWAVKGGWYEKIKYISVYMYDSKLCNIILDIHCLSYSMAELSKPHWGLGIPNWPPNLYQFLHWVHHFCPSFFALI